MSFGYDQEELRDKIEPIAFQTSGCPGCNRPFYNEKPGGLLYNYPYTPSINDYNKALRAVMIDLEEYHG